MTERTNEAAGQAMAAAFRRADDARHGRIFPPAHPNPEPPTGDGEREGVGRRG